MVENKAKEMFGKYVLVEIKRRDENNVVISSEEVYGLIQRFSQNDGLIISQCDGTERSLPPLLDCYHQAEEGVYKLIHTGKTIERPDYVATFYVSKN